MILFALGLLLNAIEAAHAAALGDVSHSRRAAAHRARVSGGGLAHRTRVRCGCRLPRSWRALAGYWAALTLVPVPGVGAGVLTPEGNLASFVDRALLGPASAQPLVRSRGAAEHGAGDRDRDVRRVRRRSG